jgi:2-hydroxy-3-keto-5-methylthiopentenyl-1-phosphate phosphatase
MDDLVILCDFDGTITTIDTAELALLKFANGDWLDLDRRLEHGDITLEECMKTQFTMVYVPEATILGSLDGAIQFRPHFPELVAACECGAIELIIVSAGLDFVIRHFVNRIGLEGRLAICSGHAQFNGRHIDFRFPPLLDPESKNFKDDLARQHMKAGKKVVYVGDGLSDLEPAKRADFVFAVRGGRLSRLCVAEHLRHVDFEDFQDIAWRIAKCVENGDERYLVSPMEP